MGLFNRKKVDPSVLPEVDQYYSAQRRDSTGLAWLLALVSIVLVAGVIVALFLGGRFIYNKVVDKPEETTNSDVAKVPSFDGNPNPATPSDRPVAPSDQEDETENAPTDNDTQEAPTPVPQVSRPNNNLPNTGAANTLAVFFAVTIIATSAHSYLSRRHTS